MKADQPDFPGFTGPRHPRAPPQPRGPDRCAARVPQKSLRDPVGTGPHCRPAAGRAGGASPRVV